MIFFWAIVDENNVESYAKSLTLPSYMSHLSMEPFQFADQVRNTTGRELLVIRYISDGRLEEYSLHPFEHAKGMIASLDSKIDSSKIEINADDAIWNWGETNQDNILQNNMTGFETANSKQSASTEIVLSNKKIMRIFFETIPNVLTQKFPLFFPPKEAYVSVSRSELFISQLVIRCYLLMRCLAIQKNSDLNDSFFQSKSFDEHSALNKATFSNSHQNQRDHFSDKNSEHYFDDLLSSLILEKTNGGFCFRLGCIGGKYLVGDENIFNDLIVFAGLDRSLKYISDYVKMDFAESKPELESDGLRFKLSNV